MATKCSECGFPLQDNDKRCPECGCPVEHVNQPALTDMAEDDGYKTFSELFWSCQFYKIFKGKHFDLGQRTYEFGIFLWEMISVAWNTTWNKFAKFTGRASRREYWSFIFGISFLNIIPLFFIIAIIPYIAISIRRMHDTNHSGWWSCVPFAVFFLSLRKSDEDVNRYG